MNIGKTLAVVGFLFIISPQAPFAAGHGSGVVKRHSTHLRFHRSVNPGGQVENEWPGTSFLVTDKDLEIPSLYRDVIPIRERATYTRTASRVVQAARFILVRPVSRNILLSSLNL